MPVEAFLLEQREERDAWIKTIKYAPSLWFYLGYQAGYKRQLIETDRLIRSKKLDYGQLKVCTPICSVQSKPVRIGAIPTSRQKRAKTESEIVDEQIASLVKYKGMERFYRFPLSEKIMIAFGVAALIFILIAAVVQFWPGLINILKSVQIISYAYADTAASANNPSTTVSFKAIVGAILTGVVAIVFLWCLRVELHSSNTKSIAAAKDYNKIILGFIIATIKNFFGA